MRAAEELSASLALAEEQETGLDQGFPHHLSGGKGPFKDCPSHNITQHCTS